MFVLFYLFSHIIYICLVTEYILVYNVFILNYSMNFS